MKRDLFQIITHLIICYDLEAEQRLNMDTFYQHILCYDNTLQGVNLHSFLRVKSSIGPLKMFQVEEEYFTKVFKIFMKMFIFFFGLCSFTISHA